MNHLPLATLTPPPTPAAVDLATAWLATLAAEQGWPARATFGLTLSLDEAMTNILMHGFADAPATFVPHLRLECLASTTEAVIRISDNGKPFDPNTIAPPDAATSLDEAKIGGHGMQLMRHYLKRLAYTRSADENHLLLVADVSGDAAPAD